MRYRIHAQRVLLAGCAVAVVVSTGCRGGMKKPSLNSFGWGKKPSAETIAGTGPSATYPLPPSQNATPNAIASIAGGTTAPTTTNGFEVNTGYAAAPPASSNPAAATANGFAPGQTMPAATTPGYGYAQAAAAGGYQYGGGTPGTTQPTAQPAGYGQLPGSYAQTAGGNTATATNGYAAPGFTAPASATGPQAPPTNYGTAGGYTLPAGLATTTPPANPSQATNSNPYQSNPYQSGPGAAASPAASTASAPPAYATPTAPRPSGGYQPGSTATGGSYPGGFGAPTSGNYVR